MRFLKHWLTSILFFVTTAFGICQVKPGSDSAIRVIFETDMGNDVDDVLALDMLYKYVDQGRVRLLGVSTNKNSGYSPIFLALMNDWYGYGKLPVGRVWRGVDSDGDAVNYAKTVCQYNRNGRAVFHLEDSSAFPESVMLYRRLLAAQPDSSVVIISVGFSTNLSRLLESIPDSLSGLNGRDLVSRKVKLLSMMGGNFDNQRIPEYNVKKDLSAARKLLDEWPGEIALSPLELGLAITYPATSIEQDFSWAVDHPLVIAYRAYQPMPYDRPTWDLTSVLYAVEGLGPYFKISRPGSVSVDKDGRTFFREAEAGKRRYLHADTTQRTIIRSRFIELVTKRPLHFHR